MPPLRFSPSSLRALVRLVREHGILPSAETDHVEAPKHPIWGALPTDAHTPMAELWAELLLRQLASRRAAEGDEPHDMSHPRSSHATYGCRLSSTSASPRRSRSRTTRRAPAASTIWLPRPADGLAGDQLPVIDDDLGLSGASSQNRAGFQRLVAAIGLGEVGIILVTEVSRLVAPATATGTASSSSARCSARSSPTRTAIYDPQNPNDQLLLGVKGTLFAAELHILQARMHGALLNKARRGELKVTPPGRLSSSPRWDRHALTPTTPCGRPCPSSSSGLPCCATHAPCSATFSRMACCCRGCCNLVPMPDGSPR